ncbi:MAG: hypothetical protein KDK23_03640 [Leptospiraceae bacterium]|nr:hypothetical protein [Leptospiraceae bacterium]
MKKQFGFGLMTIMGLFLAGVLLGQPTQGPGGPGKGPGKGQGPCMQDVQRLCPNASSRQERMQCMRDNKDNLSEACKARIEKGKNKMKNMHEACADDRAKFCKGVKPGEGRMRDCYLQHQSELSQKCKDAMPPGFFDRNPPPEVESEAQ